jgi:hypothetical protein
VTRLNPQAEKVASGMAAIAAGYWGWCSVKQGTGQLSCRSQRVAGNNQISLGGWMASNVTQVGISGGHAIARMGDGSVVTFGQNSTGERGGAVLDGAPPFTIPDFGSVTQVTAGGRGNSHNANRFGCAVKTDQSVWCWGKGNHGQLGNNNSASSSIPVQVINTGDTPIAATQVTAGMSHACALNSGSVVCWGRGSEGEIGSGNTSSYVPRAESIVSDPVITTAVNIEASGTRGTCAALANGSLRCWGQISGAIYTAPEPVFAFEP